MNTLKLGDKMRVINTRKNACDEPIVLTEREQQIMQELWEQFEVHGGFTPHKDLNCTEQEYNDLRIKFF